MFFWITGSVRSGKTATLIAQLEKWSDRPGAQQLLGQPNAGSAARDKMILAFAANADNRSVLVRRVAEQLKGRGSIKFTTPLAFFEAEVQLFWPLAVQQLGLHGYFPYRLRPETEQALAVRLWGEDFIKRFQQWDGASLDRWVRRVLDLIQLAASSGTPFTDLAARLKVGSADSQPLLPEPLADLAQQMALEWRDWCLPRGVLTYGLITDLFGQCILSHPVYRSQISQRFAAIAADDVENYPAIARSFFETALDLGLPSIFTYSELGGIRDGLGADSVYLLGLRQRCTEIALPSAAGLAEAARVSIADLPFALQEASAQRQPEFYALKTTSRFELLQAVAQQVADSIQAGVVLPHEVAILGPGLDPLARFGIIETLQRAGIAVESLRDQRPILSTAIVRSLLTLMALVYPGLGHLLETEQIAEMLVVLSTVRAPANGLERSSAIDPVRAGLLADYCFRPHPDRPELLPIEVYARWDRLGHSTANAYETLRQWIAQQQGSLNGSSANPLARDRSTAYLTLSPVFVLDRAIQTFLMPRPLTVDQLAVLRELIETAQHYWDVDAHLRKMENPWPTLTETVGAFIQLLYRGIVTANPYPTTIAQQARSSVILATTFQYLNARLDRRWQFWLDAGSQLWQYSGDLQLWGAPLFLKANAEGLPDPGGQMQEFNSPLQNTLLNLLGRVQNRVYLCHSELAVNGQPQTGPLLPWIELALPAET
ncbi:recombinase family protein [Altericista sp. CCNU0014]|uniref:recombinase family protein n=1 Tax=Altericista sp. CCNU0014 TaxID=3082949 RepID=UPI00384CED94